MAVMLTIQPGYMGNDNKKVYGAESTKADSFIYRLPMQMV